MRFGKIKPMKIVQKIILVCAIILIIVNILMIDFDNLSWKINKHTYMQIIAMSFVVVSMVLNLKTKIKLHI